MRAVSVGVPRALLFVPVLRDRYIEKALTSGADAIILDLEDGIASGEKNQARAALAGAADRLRSQRIPTFVRVNRDSREDLLACAAVRPDAVMLPKVETVAEVVQAAQTLAGAIRGAGVPPLFVCLESAGGVLRAEAIAAADAAIAGLMFGAGDFVVSIGLEPRLEVLRAPALHVVLAAAAHGLPAFGLPGLISGYRDLVGFEQLAREAKSLGFVGAPAIHPAQVPLLQRVFRPSAAELEHARKIVAAFERNNGPGLTEEGELVEAGICARARAVLAEAAERPAGAAATHGSMFRPSAGEGAK